MPTRFFCRQAYAIPVLGFFNIALGFFAVGYDPVTQTISEMALQTPGAAWTHRTLDVLIGVSMCLFAVGSHGLSGKRFSFTLVVVSLVGVSMISAGIWILESPLHELFGLSIFLIVVPVVFALELRDALRSPNFELYSLGMMFLHVTMFWLIYAGFIPDEYQGLNQRLWSLLTMLWYGVAAHVLLKRSPALAGAAVRP